MSLIDIHIGVLPNRNTVGAAISSICDPKITYHIIDDAQSILELRSRGYAMGTSEYVSFCDDDDTFLNIDQIIKEAESGTPAFFTNSIYNHEGYPSLMLYPPDFKWSGVESYKQYFPHNPYIVKRDIMIEAVENAKKRILSSDIQHSNSGVDFAIGFEVQLLVGWKYLPIDGYVWNRSNDSSSKRTGQQKNHAFIREFYRKLI